MDPVALFAIIVAAPGVILIALALRGRRLDRLPRCRRCRYDLTGLDDAPSCPECGRSLEGRRARRAGLRQRRPILLTLGLALLMLLIPPAVWWNAGRRPMTSRPVWRLLADARWSMGSQGDDKLAADELVRRWQAGTLDPDASTAIANAITHAWTQGPPDSPLRNPSYFDVGMSLSAFSHDQQVAIFRAALADLADDDIPGNATRAEQLITSIAWQARGALEEALASADAQQALLVARILQDTWQLDALESPPKSLLEHAGASLRSDSSWSNARIAQRVLSNAGEEARDQLERAIDSDDPQEAFRAASMLSRLGRTDRHDRLVELAIASLHDDDVRDNRWWGESYLWDNSTRDDLPAIEAALASDDPQQRIAVASLLPSLYQRLEATPAPEAIAQWVAMLRDGAEGWISSALRGLALAPEDAEPLLRDALASNDPQQRFLAACVLASTRRLAPGEPAIETLVTHIADNDVQGDAAYAAAALYQLGEPARAPLLEARSSTDAQLARQASDILWAWTLKRDTPRELTRPLSSFSYLYFPFESRASE